MCISLAMLWFSVIHQFSLQTMIKSLESYKTLHQHLLGKHLTPEERNEILEYYKNGRVTLTTIDGDESLLGRIARDAELLLISLPTLYSEGFSSESEEIFLFYYLQFFVNYLVQCKQFRNEILLELTQDQFLQALSSLISEKAFDSPKILRFTCVLMNTLIKDINDKYYDSILRSKIVRRLCKRLRSIYLTKDMEKGLNEQEGDSLFEWFSLFFNSLLTHGYKEDPDAKQLKYNENPTPNLVYILFLFSNEEDFTAFSELFHKFVDGDSNHHPLNEEHLHLLYFLLHQFQRLIDDRNAVSLVLECDPLISWHFKDMYYQDHWPSKQQFQLRIMFQDYLILARVFKRFGISIKEIISALKLSADQAIVNGISPEIKLNLDQKLHFFHMLLKILCLFLFVGGYNPRLQDIFTPVEEIKILLSFLEEIAGNPLLDVANKEGTLIADRENLIEIKTHFVRFLANLTHLNHAFVDAVVENKLLTRLLNYTDIDEHNPMLKEWSIVLIRNITEISEKAVEIMKGLKFAGYDDKSRDMVDKILNKSRNPLEKFLQ
eukprot:TRINITY_DN11867_c0_g1_i4.p1 TRINITY_DN11867_c0_g1~~TRINITY_DN11867_c0_g1_i4.p1  ORF type:complete len:548 (-),score=69.79 TRINITY_DN11867_c0_g1_i4:268-1911(-)